MTKAREGESLDLERVQAELRHQWGTEKHVGAAPVIHAVPTRRALIGARSALFMSMAAWLAYFIEQLRGLASRPADLLQTSEAILYIVLVTLLAASASAYLLCRLGYLSRARLYRRDPRAVIDALYDDISRSLTVIIPSYREEPRVIRQTLLSAALQEYPDLNVVLLVDDPPNPSDPEAQKTLAETRSLTGEIASLLAGQGLHFDDALHQFESSACREGPVPGEALNRAAEIYDDAICWLHDLAHEQEIVDHSDAFLANEVILRLACDLEATAKALREAYGAGAEMSYTRVRHLYRRLTWIFGAELTTFERKRYASLSHEPNKASNLNSYLGLMGRRYRVAETPGGTVLLPVRGLDFDLEVAEPDYVLTLDADSMLLPEYCLRLVAFMEREENADVAVAQTPYSAYRGAPTRIERLAGATTDLQHLIHQGLAHYGATFWVGANAVLRKSALDQIMIEETNNGFAVRRYIQDRTVVEDTESSLDLRLDGWRLENIPERLSYSATPPDLGALCIQRERWANGGLMILPKLFRLARSLRHDRQVRPLELFLRLNYLASIAWTSLGLSILLFFPFNQRLLSSLAVLTALPYFVAMANDLHRAGYRRSDVIRLYGFNMMMLPINVMGTLKSLGQIIGGQKVPFVRTPKVQQRTVTPLIFVLVPFVIVDWSGFTLLYDVLDHNYLHAAFAGVNAGATLFALLTLHGWRNSLVDAFINAREWVLRPVKQPARDEKRADWVTVLYYGATTPGESQENAAVAGALAAMDQERAESRTAMLPSDHSRLAIVQTNDRSKPETDEDGNTPLDEYTGMSPSAHSWRHVAGSPSL